MAKKENEPKVLKRINNKTGSVSYIAAFCNENGEYQRIYYGESMYGKYAEELAKMTLTKKKRINNYIIESSEYENSMEMIVYNKTENQYYNVLFDKEDLDKIKDIYWFTKVVKKPSGDQIYIRGTSEQILLHRFLLGVEHDFNVKSNVIDHINRNTLDNRKSNLRLTTNSGNQRNKSIQSNNTSGVPGVNYYKRKGRSDMWVASCKDLNGKTVSKRFSINKYGNDEAFEMAKKARFEMMKEYGYIKGDE